MTISTPILANEGRLPVAEPVAVSADMACEMPVGAEGANHARQQVAALCWRLHRKRVQVLLVTSRDTGRWVLPKGWPMAGLGPEAAAAREAWEEAGVTGKVGAIRIGLFHYDKAVAGLEAIPCAVEVFCLRVQKLSTKFPERDQRRRKWFAALEAAVMVAEPELRALLSGLESAPDLLTAGTARKPALRP